jgi:hypothetical protein
MAAMSNLPDSTELSAPSSETSFHGLTGAFCLALISSICIGHLMMKKAALCAGLVQSAEDR